jgi:NAD(P)-dependent dehydrogenase (short-subunit alcohol dehydrogenase family)
MGGHPVRHDAGHPVTGHQWTLDDIPDLRGRRALVTGVTSGLGEHTVLELARKGAHVVMAARDGRKLDAAVERLHRALPLAQTTPVVLDLADLGTVRRAAEEVSTAGPLDILVNNAGVMATPRRRTVDGFELQFGTNHLGHFALTGLLFPQLAAAESARVVTVASQAHRYAGTVPLTDPRVPARRYRKWKAYAQSKLANLLFAFELDRRCRALGTSVTSVAAHPGYTVTNLQRAGLSMNGRSPDGAIIVGATRLLGQSAALGAQPSLMAATLPELPGGSYCGPRGFGEVRGLPTVVKAAPVAYDEALANALWALSETATGVRIP